MMLKGCSKRVIVIKDTGNDLFEEAIFFLKPEKDKSTKLKTDEDFVTEANKLISTKSLDGFSCGALTHATDKTPKTKKPLDSKKREIKIFFSGAAIATAGAVILTVLL